MKLLTDSCTLGKSHAVSIATELTKDHCASKVLLVLEIEGADATTIKNKITEVFDDNFFFEDISVLLRFEECMKKVNEIVKDTQDPISGVIAVQEHSELHLSQVGKGEAYLIRKGKLNVIIEGSNTSEEAPEEPFASIASGEILVDDRVILSSLRLLRFATASQLTNVLSEGISEGVAAIKDLLELESQTGSVTCFHTKGASVFSAVQSPHIARSHRSPFIQDVLIRFEKIVGKLSELTGKSYETTQNLLFGAISIILIITLVGLIAQASISNSEKQKYETYKLNMLEMEKNLQIAEQRTQMKEITSANAILDKIEKDVKEMLKEGVFTEQGLTILERIQAQRDASNNIKRFSDMDNRVLADIVKAFPQEKVRGIVSFAGDTYAVTATGLYKTVLNHIDPKITVTDKDEIVRTSFFPDKKLVLITLSSGGFKEFNGTATVSASTADAAGFKKAVAAKAYNRFMYFLDPQGNQIWRYERKRDAYSGASGWITESPSVSDAIDFAIDGSVYVLKKDGGLSQYYKGKPVSVNIQGGAADLLIGATKIFVQQDMKHVYFLSKKRNSVIAYNIVNNGLQFSQEYVFKTKTPVTDFTVDANEQRLILSDEEKLYEVTLSQ